MDGKGRITAEMWGVAEGLVINITDSGKGIARSKFTTVLNPDILPKAGAGGLDSVYANALLRSITKEEKFTCLTRSLTGHDLPDRA